MKTFPILRVPLTLITFFCLVAVASAKTVYVKQNATGANNGSSWTNAYKTLQAAMTAAASGDQVWIAAGTYRPNDNAPGNLSRTQFFQLKKGVAVYGGFAGSETLLTQRSAAVNPVILSGDLQRNDSAANTNATSSTATTADNVYHVFFHSLTGLTASAVLDSVTIRGGNANSTTDMYGGAIYNSMSSPSLINCTFVDNAANFGGAVFNSSSSPVLNGCTLSFNTATNLGGAIYNVSSASPTLMNCTLAYNSATTGGAIMNSISTLTLVNCTVAYNSSALLAPGSGNPSGSGIRSAISSSKSSQSTIFLTNCILWGNLNSDQLWGGNTTASNCIIQGGFVGPIPGVEEYHLSNIFSFDPLLTPLNNYGGSTPTITFPPTSPAINAGTNTAQTPALDQRGITRDSQPDLGATEYPIYVGAGSGGPGIAIGASATLPVWTSLPGPTYQWYRGVSGDVSDPIPGAAGNSYFTPSLELGADFWVAVTSGGSTQASPTISIPVRGNYEQWTTFHGLQAADASVDACPANDGVSNLVKYAVGLDPFTPSAQSSYLQTSMDTSNGNLNLDLTLSRTPTDLSWSILESGEISTWTVTAGTTNPTVTSTARQTHRLAQPVNQAGKFFKVRFQTAQ